MISSRRTLVCDFDSPCFRELASHRTTEGAWTLLIGDEVVAILGIATFWSGVGHVWALVTDKVEECPLGFTRLARGLLKKQMAEGGYHRVHAMIGDDYRSLRWARLCGLNPEVKLEKMLSDGSDCWVYSLIGD